MRPGFALSFPSVHSGSVVFAATRVFWDYLMIRTDVSITAEALLPQIEVVWGLSASKIDLLTGGRSTGDGSPVFTVRGRYTSKGWTEWTQGFEFGSALLQFDATNEQRFLDFGRSKTRAVMAGHITHMGVHDHGFNNISTYGNLRRLILERRFAPDPAELDFCELALKCSGAVQARRWTPTAEGGGFIRSTGAFAFADTMRSLRSLSLAHKLGHTLFKNRTRGFAAVENGCSRQTTARHAVSTGGPTHMMCAGSSTSAYSTSTMGYFAEQPASYSAFSTWTRASMGDARRGELNSNGFQTASWILESRTRVEAMMRRAAEHVRLYRQEQPH